MFNFNSLFSRKFNHQYAVVVNGIPKSGSNLLLNIAKAIPNLNKRKGSFHLTQRFPDDISKMNYILENVTSVQNGYLFYGHVPYFELYDEWLTKNNIKQLFIYRDPRAVVTSAFHYILEMKKNQQINYELLMNGTSNTDKFIDLIEGIGEGKHSLTANEKSLPGIKSIYEGYRPWLSNKNTLAIKYEDLIENNIKKTEEILYFLNFKRGSEIKEALNIFNKGANPDQSKTFRQGGVDKWKEEFNDSRTALFNTIMPKELMEIYGYKF